jgi:hypothetical protein
VIVASTPDAIVRRYYDHLNARRITELAAMVAPDAVVQHLLFDPATGPDGCIQFAGHWLRAFPDAHFWIDAIAQRAPALFEVEITVTGTHRGTLEMGAYRFRPSGAATPVQMRHLVELCGDQIVFSNLSIDLHDFVQQLVPVDVPALLERLERIRQLGAALEALHSDPDRLREVLLRLGAELDTARKVLRPYFYR